MKRRYVTIHDSSTGHYGVWDNVKQERVLSWYRTQDEADSQTAELNRRRRETGEAERIADWVESLARYHDGPPRAALMHVVYGIRRGEY